VIRTPDQRLRVFVSSTLQELAGERAAAKEAIQRIRLTPVMFETSARPHPPRDLYRAYLAQSDVFVGIYWQHYGWIAPNEIVSGLEDEYLLAQQMPKLVYIKSADTREDRLDDLISRIRDEDTVSYRPFADAGELQDLIENDLAIVLTERFTASSTAATSDSATEPTFDAPPRSLAPVERGELIGREPEVEVVTELLRRPDTGLITLTGPGGTGKTRLAIHLANALGAWFSDGVFYVPLADVRNADEVLSFIVSTLEIPSPPGGANPERLLLGFLRARRALLVLDNFEQVLEAAADVANLLEACPYLKILATSREPLRIRGEREVPVPPLPHAFRSDGALTPAMQLFEERAREVRPDFAIDDSNRAAVAEVCQRVDALPLAIELAAARVRVLSPQVMVPRLSQSLSLLSGAKRDLPERQQTLRATIEWSLDLLRPEELLVFRRLGIFDGSFSEAAAAAVVAEAGLDVLEGLTSLVEKSLLVRSEMRGEARFHLLETVRELARELVAEAGEEQSARLRHGEWVARLLASEHRNLLSAQARQAAHQRLASEVTGARMALRFAASADGDYELAWRLFISLGAALMVTYAQTAEVLATYELMKVLPQSDDALRAMQALGVWSWARAAMANSAAAPDLEAVCAVLEDAGERDFLMCFQTAWGTLLAPSSLPRALLILDRARRLAHDEGQTTVENWALMTMTYGHLHAGAIDDAQRCADEFASIGRGSGDEETLAYAHLVGARVKLMKGDLVAARSLFADAAALARVRSAAWGRAMALCGLASVTLGAGDEVGARAILEEALFFCAGVGYVGTDSLCGAIALFLGRAGERNRALRVFEGVAADTENDTSFTATLTDPTGALRTATREARALLGDPTHSTDPAIIDFDAVLHAALGDDRQLFGDTQEGINEPRIASTTN
jgi:predicted ATPase